MREPLGVPRPIPRRGAPGQDVVAGRGEWVEFFDNNVGEAVLLQEIGDTKITEPKTERK